MKNALSWTLILMIGGVKFETSSSESPPKKNDEPLLLTPYIEGGRIWEARDASKVEMFKTMANVMAYSGFITVNSTCNSSLFFLFLVSENNKTDDPLTLWTQGGPGLSALFGELLENGPIAYDVTTKNLTIRNNTLQKISNIIYLDLPVGAGFSFTKDTKCYSKNLKDITDDVMEFLKQFLALFPEYVCRAFYVAGESYAARYSVSIANRMLNSNNDKLLLLKGVIGGNGFLSPILSLADSSDFMYQLSMLDEKGHEDFSEKFQQMRNQTDQMIVIYELSRTLFTNESIHTLYQNLTLYNDYLSPLLTERSPSVIGCFFLLNNNSEFKRALHVDPNAPFQYNDTNLLQSLVSDYLTNISGMLSNVLSNTRVLLYTGQLDPLFPSVNQRAYLSTLQWKEADAYKNASRFLWKPTNESYNFAGFLTKTSNFTYAVMLGMSHYGAADKPDEVYYLMKEFMTNYTGAVTKTS